MKKIILLYFVPLFIVLFCFFKFSDKINSVFFYQEQNAAVDSSFNCIANFGNSTYYEDRFLNTTDSNETIFILGSSELASETEAHPYNFISSHFKTQLKGVGHAGNQCFSIYSQLLANEKRLKNAPIVIVLSPGWFSEYAKGTSSSIFLEFNSSRYLTQIFQNKTLPEFKAYEAKRISDLYTEFSNADLTLTMFYLEAQASKNIFFKAFYFPIIETIKVLNTLKLDLKKSNYEETTSVKRKTIVAESLTINWDSLFISAKQQQINNSNNNKWFIKNSYYSEHVNGKTRTIPLVSDDANQELKDLKMLLKLLKTKEVNASFVMLPLSPYCYTNTKELTPLITAITNELKNNNFPCLNLWNDDSTKFDNGILSDVMHLSTYGWFKVDKFIVETYKLSK
jgi:D-alanyl-lipoteichoic acid biosynthesis protein DltD